MDGDEDIHCLDYNLGKDIAVKELGFRPDDYLIPKRRYSCFYGTDLEILLRGLKVDTLILVGGSSIEAHEASLKAMEYLQTGAIRSLDEVVNVMESISV